MRRSCIWSWITCLGATFDPTSKTASGQRCARLRECLEKMTKRQMIRGIGRKQNSHCWNCLCLGVPTCKEYCSSRYEARCKYVWWSFSKTRHLKKRAAKQNILLDEHGHAYLSDFNIATRIKDKPLKAVAGTEPCKIFLVGLLCVSLTS